MRAQNAEDGIADDLSGYITSNDAAVAAQSDVDQNEADADAAIAAVASDLSAYETSNDAAVAAVVADLAQELLDRAAGDALERAHALAARDEMKEELDADIAAVQADVDANEAAIEASLATEASERQTGDAGLQAQIDALTSSSSGAVAAEQARAEAAEAVLTADVSELNADVLALHGRMAMEELVADGDFEAGQFTFGADLFDAPVMVTVIFSNGMRLHSS